MSKDYRQDEKDKDLTNTSASRRGENDQTPDQHSNVPTSKHSTTMGSSVTADGSDSVSGVQDGTSRGLTSRTDLGGTQTGSAQPMGGLGGRAESKAGEKESDQQKIGGTTIDNQGDNPALRK